MSIETTAEAKSKDNSHLLILIGVIFLPILFGWFTLSKRFGNGARIFSFTWAALTTAFGLYMQSPGMVAQEKAREAVAAKTAEVQKAADTATAQADLVKLKPMNKAEAKTFWAALNAKTAPCDSYGKIVANALGSYDSYRVYKAAQAGEETCQSVEHAISAIDLPPSATGEALKDFKEARSQMAYAYLTKQTIFHTLGGLTNNGRMKPSDIDELSTDTALAQMTVIKAIGSFDSALEKEGITADEVIGTGGKASQHRKHHG